MDNTIIIGTRGSELALWQAHHVKGLLENLGHMCELHIIKTKGDNIQHLSFDKIEGKGFFTKEIEEALLKKEIDVAVHSHKDLETDQPEGLVVAAVSPRADARELLLIRPESADSSKFFSLKENAIVGTSSARRKSQMLHHRPDIQLADIRGNVTTRIQKLRDGQFDAILLAKAGVDRLKADISGLEVVIPETDVFVPAPAQGVLGIQCRANDERVISILQNINDAPTQSIIRIERTVLNRLQGGCQLPLGIHVTKNKDAFHAQVSIANTWDAPVRHFHKTGNDADVLIDDILKQIYS